MKASERFMLIFAVLPLWTALIVVGIIILFSVVESYLVFRLKAKKVLYQHYKNKAVYEKLMVVKNADDPTEEMVVYRSIEEGELWVRPKWAFEQRVLPPGGVIETVRFRRVFD